MLRIAIAASVSVLLHAQPPPVAVTTVAVDAGDWASATLREHVLVAWADGSGVRLRRSTDHGSTWEPEQVLHLGSGCSAVRCSAHRGSTVVALCWRVAGPAGDAIMTSASMSAAAGSWTAPLVVNTRTGGSRTDPCVALALTGPAPVQPCVQLAWREGPGDVYWQRTDGASVLQPERLVHSGTSVQELRITADWVFHFQPFEMCVQTLLAWRDDAGGSAHVRSALCAHATAAAPSFALTTHASGRVDGVAALCTAATMLGFVNGSAEHFVLWRERHSAADAVVADATTVAAQPTAPAWTRAAMPLPSGARVGLPAAVLVPAGLTLPFPSPSELVVAVEQAGTILAAVASQAPSLQFSPAAALSQPGDPVVAPVLARDDHCVFCAWRRQVPAAARLEWNRSLDRGASWLPPHDALAAAVPLAPAAALSSTHTVGGNHGGYGFGLASHVLAVGDGGHPGLWLQQTIGSRRTGAIAGPSQPRLDLVAGDGLAGATLHYKLVADVPFGQQAWFLRSAMPGPVDLGAAVPACAGRLLWVGADAHPVSTVLQSPSPGTFLVTIPNSPAVLGSTVRVAAMVLQPGAACPFDVANGFATYVH
jgi:hypothetical protein